MSDAGERNFGRAQVALAALMWSTSGIFAKAPLFADWPVEHRGMVLAVYRALFAGLIVLPMVRSIRWDWRLIPMALAYAAISFTYLTSMTLTTAANAIWLQSTAPLWVAMIGAALGWEKPTKRDVLVLAVIAAGITLILGMEMSQRRDGDTNWAGVLWGAGSGVAFALVVLSLRRLRDHNAAYLTAINQFTAALLILPLAISSGIEPTGFQLLVLAAFGVFQLGVPYFLFTRGLKSVTSTEGSVIGLIEPLMLPIWTYMVWGEKVAWWTIVGAGMILGGLIVRFGAPRRAAAATEAQATAPT